MPITTVTGDLFEDKKIHALAHGCNCSGAMGKGIALEFRKRFPLMYKEYKSRCALGQFQLGDVFFWKEKETIVFNLGIQQSWRSKAQILPLKHL